MFAVIAPVLLLSVGTENAETEADWPGLAVLSAGLVAVLTLLIHDQQEDWACVPTCGPPMLGPVDCRR
ncbi:hypothetical protein [Mycobacterium lepromatosis]|uniref:hypothetical protein n=1 Tax=Mycobacterium lepromatosis TaxID=480418 RepID=UPI000B2B188E|nr:hypothetical protein [Mycobacterium lepromatosis]